MCTGNTLIERLSGQTGFKLRPWTGSHDMEEYLHLV